MIFLLDPFCWIDMKTFSFDFVKANLISMCELVPIECKIINNHFNAGPSEAKALRRCEQTNE